MKKDVDKGELLRFIKRRMNQIQEEKPKSYELMGIEETDSGEWELSKLEKTIEVGVLEADDTRKKERQKIKALVEERIEELNERIKEAEEKDIEIELDVALNQLYKLKGKIEGDES